MGLKHRLGRLEGNRRGGCPECARRLADLPGGLLEVTWDLDAAGDARGEPERCPRCGRPTKIVVTWGDGEEGDASW